MKIYEISLKAETPFITQINADTLFGCLCWQLNNAGIDLNSLIEIYDKEPFMVVSSGIYKNENNMYILPKPLCPNYIMFDINDVNYKKNNKKKFFGLSSNTVININKIDFKENIKDYFSFDIQQHNTINRITNTTGKGFDPFYNEVTFYENKGNIIVFVALDETKLSIDNLQKAFENLGKTGYGKKASSGYGHFKVNSFNESILWKNDFSKCNYLYSLAPFILSEEEKINLNNIYFQPVTRYGKHGDILAKSENPFKKPVIVADTASLVSLKTKFDKNKPFIGKAIKDISYVDNKTVFQGYALCLPCILEE